MSEKDHWIKIKEISEDLLDADPDAYIIMSKLMFQCRRLAKNKYLRKNLKLGQAIITKPNEMSDRRWRDGKLRIEHEHKLASFVGCNTGSLGTILNTEFCDLNFTKNDQDEPMTSKTTNKETSKHNHLNDCYEGTYDDSHSENDEPNDEPMTSQRRANDERPLGTFDRSEEVKNHHLLQRGEDSEDMEVALEASLTSTSPSSLLLHKNFKGRKGPTWRTKYYPDWEMNADPVRKEQTSWPTIAEIVKRYQIPESDILKWLHFHSNDKIIDTFKLMEMRKPEWVIKFNPQLEQSQLDNVRYVAFDNNRHIIKWIQSALTNNWAEQEHYRTINRVRIPQLIKENDMLQHFDFTQDYCRDKETQNDFQYALDPDMLYAHVKRILQQKIQNMMAEIT